MRKVIFSINSTINGFADHTTVIADDELHDFYTNQLDDVDIILMGRKTYELMASFWPVAHKDPRSTESIKRFANKFNTMRKIVFSNSLNKVEWQNSTLADKSLVSTVTELKKLKGKNISAGSLSIACQLLKRDLIDEFWFLVQPIIAGQGLRLLEEFDKTVNLQLIDLKKFGSGVVALHYKRI
jgi:dihydrofolate reductase